VGNVTSCAETLWDRLAVSTMPSTADFAMSMPISAVFPIVHTPYKHYEVLSFT
jgi:hypothetical protein